MTQNVQLALEEGVAGVFIINHDFDYPQLLPILRQVRGRFPDAFVGVNFHTINGGEAFPILGRLAREGVKMDAYWADNACIQDASIDQVSALPPPALSPISLALVIPWQAILGVCCM